MVEHGMTGAHVSAALPCSLEPFVLFSDPGVSENGGCGTWDSVLCQSREVPTCVDLEWLQHTLYRCLCALYRTCASNPGMAELPTFIAGTRLEFFDTNIVHGNSKIGVQWPIRVDTPSGVRQF